VTISALQKLFMMLDQRIELLMVIGYNPSHSNINSEVHAPFKILSTLLRFIENETNLANSGKLRNNDLYDGEEVKAGSMGGYGLQRNKDYDPINMNSGGRLDTMEDYNNQYGEDDDEDGGRQELDNGNESDSSEGEKNFGSDENNCSDGEDNRKGQKQTSSQKQRRNKRGGLNTSQEKIEVTLDDIEDDDD
jgi:hypothetical protein